MFVKFKTLGLRALLPRQFSYYFAYMTEKDAVQGQPVLGSGNREGEGLSHKKERYREIARQFLSETGRNNSLRSHSKGHIYTNDPGVTVHITPEQYEKEKWQHKQRHLSLQEGKIDGSHAIYKTKKNLIVKESLRQKFGTRKELTKETNRDESEIQENTSKQSVIYRFEYETVKPYTNVVDQILDIRDNGFNGFGRRAHRRYFPIHQNISKYHFSSGTSYQNKPVLAPAHGSKRTDLESPTPDSAPKREPGRRHDISRPKPPKEKRR